MFSHVLVNYQNSLLEFTTKAAETLNLTAQMLSETPSYEFSILKELSQAPVEEQNESLNPSDKDRILFFQVSHFIAFYTRMILFIISLFHYINKYLSYRKNLKTTRKRLRELQNLFRLHKKRYRHHPMKQLKVPSGI